jgi:hypothetical protein
MDAIEGITQTIEVEHERGNVRENGIRIGMCTTKIT